MIGIVGARVRRIDRPTSELLAIEIAAGDRAVLLVSVSAAAAGLGLVRNRPKGRPIDSFGGLLRKHLESSAIVAIESDRSGTRIVFSTEAGPLVLEALASRDGRGFRLANADGRRLGESGGRLPELADLPPVDEASVADAGDDLLARNASAAFDARVRAVRTALDRAITRSSRKCEAIARDVARASDVPALRAEADLLVAFAKDDVPGRAAIVVPDWSTDPPTERTIALLPSIGPRSAAARRYHEAKRLERGTKIAASRLAIAETTRDELLALRAALDVAADDEALTPLESALDLDSAPTNKARSSSPQSATRVPYREFRSARGLVIWVGKSSADNDELTVRVARPHHLFLHVRGFSGSHVIVALPKGGICDEATLVDAATLAAHFSSVRGEGTVEVQYVPKKHVRKRRGSAPGAVEVDREKVMVLRLEPARLRRLLDSENATPKRANAPGKS